jgi:hypothetical protein
MNKTFVNVLHGVVMGAVISVALYGPIYFDWKW